MRRKPLGLSQVAALAGLSLLSLGIGLERAGRLTYHEAITAQSAREMLTSGNALVPTLDGRPWLEKPPLVIWTSALGGAFVGDVTPLVARLPSVLAGSALALGVASLAARRLGRSGGLLAGLVQVTTAWTVMRGRLAEADILLACLVTWTIEAFDRIREASRATNPVVEEAGRGWHFGAPSPRPGSSEGARWLFFALLGATSLAKGIGFGAVLVLATIGVTLAWDRDRATLRALVFPRGWLLGLVIGLAWPVLVWKRYPEVWGLWTLHITDRLSARPAHFAGEPWWEYILAPFWQTLPWTPLALAGALRSLHAGRKRADSLLWAWAIVPALLVSAASVRNAHYVIYALPPWSIAAASSLLRLNERLKHRSWTPQRIRRFAVVGFTTLGLAYGLGFALLGPPFDRRGSEWAFYEDAGRRLAPEEPMVLFYDDWDGSLYPTPFGPLPHDLPVRLFYLNRSAWWCQGIDALKKSEPRAMSYGVIARERDVPDLERLGRLEKIATGPTGRPDRSYVLYRVRPFKPARARLLQADRRPARAPSAAGRPDRATK